MRLVSSYIILLPYYYFVIDIHLKYGGIFWCSSRFTIRVFKTSKRARGCNWGGNSFPVDINITLSKF